MAAGPLSRAGLDTLSGSDDRELFLEKFAGEVMVSFEEANVMKDLHMTRTISSGKAAQFPVTGRAQATYLKPGNNILLSTDSNDDSDTAMQSIAHSERVITIDDILQASQLVFSLDEWQADFDIRSNYSTSLGRALAREFDHNTLRTVTAAARETTHVLTAGAYTHEAGESLTDADFNTNGASAVGTIFEIAQKFDEKHVPDMERVIVVSPQCYYKLAQQTDLLDVDFNEGGNGSLKRGRVMMAAGIRIVKSAHLGNNLIGLDESGGGGLGGVGDADRPGASATHVQNDLFGASGMGYGGNFSNTLAIAFQKEAIGTVKLRDLTVEEQYKLEYKGNLVVASYAMGHGILRSECAIEVVSA